jgi:predicted Holliday junction resolvase-like endonuclease
MDYTPIVWIGIGIVIVVYIWITNIRTAHKSQITELQKQVENYTKIITDRDENIKSYAHLNEIQKVQYQRNEAQMKLQSQQWAITEFEKFKSNELLALKKQLEDNAIAAALNLLQKWKIENEAKIRQDAANRSYAVNLGKITEHLVPFHAKFPFNPKDARFIGSPIDLIVFDGLDEDKDDITIYFVEIKTGKSRLSARQAKIKSAVEKREIVWYPVNSDDL